MFYFVLVRTNVFSMVFKLNKHAMHSTYLLITSFCLAVHATTDAYVDPPYCAARYRRLCQGKGPHIACQFPTPVPGESCLNYTLIKFTKELRHFVTHYINRRRQRLAAGNERVRGGVHVPRPQVMMQVEWDRELAALAQRLANQCNFVHDDCRATVRYPYAGQAVGEVKWRRSLESERQITARAIRRILDAWWGERRRVTIKQLTQPFRLIKGIVWGHFSQLAVWTLRAVGCGAVRHGIRYPRILLVCDFSHTNMLGQRTLVPGPLAPCPIHTTRRPRSAYPLLCVSVRHFLESEQATSEQSHFGSHSYDSDCDLNEELYEEQHEESPINEIESSSIIKPNTTNDLRQELPADTETERKDIENTEIDIEELETQTVKFESHLTNTPKTKYQKVSRHFIKPKFDKEADTDKKTFQWDEVSFEMGRGIEKARHKIIDDNNGDYYVTRWQVTDSYLRFKTKEWPIHQQYSVIKNKLEHPQTEAPNAFSTLYFEPIRHRWRPTRDRPDRPGAKALLVISEASTSSWPRAAKKASSMPLKMDKEDVEQLFQDTGFIPGQKKTF